MVRWSDKGEKANLIPRTRRDDQPYPVGVERGCEALECGTEHGYESHCEEEVPVYAILCHMLLKERPRASFSQLFQDLNDSARTGYSTPFTMTTLTHPRAMIGRAFLAECRTDARYGLWSVWRKSGSDDITPNENTNDPTPRSICENRRQRRCTRRHRSKASVATCE